MSQRKKKVLDIVTKYQSFCLAQGSKLAENQLFSIGIPFQFSSNVIQNRTFSIEVAFKSQVHSSFIAIFSEFEILKCNFANNQKKVFARALYNEFFDFW